MSFSPLDNHEGESPMANLPRVTMCLDKEFPDEFKEELPDHPKSENMQVFARVRPMLQKEEDEGYRDCVSAIDDETVRAIVPANSMKFKNSGLNPQDVYDFKYNQAFGPDVGQFVFFENTIMDTMLGYIEGQNCLIFNYGITNSGKTYTLQGNEANPGIIPLAMHMFFGCIESQLMDEICVKPEKYSDITVLSDSERALEYRLKEELLRIVDHDSFNKTSASDTSAVGKPSKSFSQVLCECFRDDFKYETDTTLPTDEMIAAQSALYMREQCKKSVDEQLGKVSIWVSFIEIYNEYAYDLLHPNIAQRQKLSFAEDQNGDVYVKGAREICVSNSMEAIKLMYVGRRNLRIASTKLNYHSSRSHCIFTVKTARVFEDEHGTSGTVNRICFCDLAGSERASKSQTSGMRLKEAGYINTSLMVLGRCLDQLRRNQTARDKKMIPFRESKLTRLFSNHFLGKGKAVMIANASPCEYTFDETLNVLRFSALAKNLAISDPYISMAQSSIVNICNQWNKSKGRVSSVSLDESSELDTSTAEELQERNKMIEELIDLCESLKDNLEQERKEKRELEFKIRQDVCNDYAAYADELLDEQKKNFETEIESLKDIYKQRYDTMKTMFEKRIHELQAELNESDESFENSINEANKTFDKMEQSLIGFSPAVGQPPKQGVKEAGGKASVLVDSSMDCFDTISEEEDAKISPDIQSLKEDLEAVTKELDDTKQKLEQTATSLKESQIEEAVAKEKCDVLNCKLLEANQVLEEYQKELTQLRTNCLSCQDEIDSLLKEKNDLQDNILSLSEQLAQSAGQVEQLRKEKLEVEEKYSQKLTESEKSIADLEQKYGAMEELKIKYSDLKEQYDMQNKITSSTAEEFNNLKEKFKTISQQLAEIEKVKEEKLELEEDFSQKMVESEKKIADLEEKCREFICQIEESSRAVDEMQKKYNDLEEEYHIYKSNTSLTAEELNDLKEKFASKVEELDLAASEIELLKKEKLGAETNFSSEKAKLNEDITILEEKHRELCLKVEDLTKILNEKKLKFDELESEYKNFKENVNAETEGNKDLNEEIAAISKELDKSNLEIISLRKEKSVLEENFAKEKEEMLKENNYVSEWCKNLTSSLETATKDLEDKMLVINELESKIENLETVCASSKSESAELLGKLENMEGKLALVTKELEEAEIAKEKLVELSAELEKITLVLEAEKSKVFELVSNCSKFETENARLLKDLKDSEEKYKLQSEKASNSKEIIECENLDGSLSNNSQEYLEITDLKLKIEELETSCAAYKSKNSELMDDVKNLQEKLDNVCQELEDSKTANKRSEELCLEFKKTEEILKEERSKTEELLSKCSCLETKNAILEEDSKTANERSKELDLELEKIKKILEKEKSKAEELLSKCECLETKNSDLLQSIKVYEETSVSEKTDDAASVKIQGLSLKLEELNQALEDKQLKIDEMEKEYYNMKSENADLTETLNAEREKCMKLSEEQALAITEIKHLQKEITQASGIHSRALSDLKMESSVAKEKCKELTLQLEKTSKIIEDQKFKIDEAEKNSLDYESQKLEFSEKLTTLREEYSSLSEIYGKLIQVLEKCELSATDKIKLLHSSSIKNVEVLTDLNRQVLEKETSIEELERALDDCQKRLKETEAKAKKQMHALKEQHSIEVEKLSDLKKFLEEENLQLKSTIDEMKKAEDAKEENIQEENEKKEETVKRSTSNVSKGKKKRSLSEVSKDEVDLSQDKENSDRETVKEKIVEEKGVSKKRRVLRQRQEITSYFNSNSESEEESEKPIVKEKEAEDEFKPKTTATTRRKAPAKEQTQQKQKKTAVQKPKLPAARTSRRKLQEETENVSPVKKAMAFVGSKLRSVAQTVSNMPSPRITRGRRKLFNADANSPMWKL